MKHQQAGSPPTNKILNKDGMGAKVRPKRQRLKYLKERVKRCWYCKTKLVYYPLKKGESIPDNYATIEHLNSKLQYPDGRPKIWGKKRTLVVACFKCNNERGKKENSQLSKEELWERSGSYPSEDVCQRCISPNPVWFAPNELWNEVAGDYNFLCPNCFIELADKKVAWRVEPETAPTKEVNQ